MEDDLYQRITRLLVSRGVSNDVEEKEFNIKETVRSVTYISKSHLDKIRSLGDLAVSHVCPVDGEKSIVRLDPPVQSGDGVLQDLDDKDSGLWTTSRDADSQVLPWLPLKSHLKIFKMKRRQ